MQKRKEDEKCVDRERNDATKKKNTRVMMKKRKGDEKRGRMKKKDEKQETRHIFRNMQILRTRQVRRTTSRTEHTDGQARRLRCVHRRPGEGRRRRCSMDVRASIRGVYERVLTGVADILFLFFFLCMQLARVLTDIVKAPADVLFF